ncbi:MAG TPA: SCO family protein [Steroidobacteraceae bacterium]
MSLRTSWMLVLLASACAAVGGAWAARDLGRTPAAVPQLASGTWLPERRSAGDFTLTDQSGAPFTQASLAGGPSILTFGFTHCPDVCPATLAMLARVSRAPGVPPVRVIFVTVDPERDTPPLLDSYVKAFDPRFIALTGAPAAIRAFAERLGVGYQRDALPGGDYTIDHTAVAFLIDPEGRIAAIFTAPFDAARFAADLRRAAPFLAVHG